MAGLVTVLATILAPSSAQNWSSVHLNLGQQLASLGYTGPPVHGHTHTSPAPARVPADLEQVELGLCSLGNGLPHSGKDAAEAGCDARVEGQQVQLLGLDAAQLPHLLLQGVSGVQSAGA